MKLVHTISILVLFILVTVSCKKNGEPGFRGDFFDCHIQQNWTAQSTFNQLLGKWQMTYASSPSGELPLENILLIFTEDETLRVFNDGQPILTTHFYIQQQDAQTYGIYTSDYSPYTDGRVLFCGGEIECNGSYIGGNDHWFRKGQ